jgi:molybdopterin/thiamine biosynthesis adenylyltransferase
MQKPTIFSAKDYEVEEIKKKCDVREVIDPYDDLLEELYCIRNPKTKFIKDYAKDLKKFVLGYAGKRGVSSAGNWVYFPWNLTLVHYLDDKEHQEIRTARNKNLILPEEQEKFYNFRIAVGGLSVGSHGAITTALMGGAKEIKLADPDILSPTNLNRNRFDFLSVGVNKCELVARYIYQLNPYGKVTTYEEGISDENISDFLDDVDLLVEELDDIEIKVKIRNEAKKRKIPVIMATDNGDNVIMDIERFDLNPDRPIFHGALEGFNVEDVKKSPEKMYEAMARIIDIRLVPERVQNSVMEVGKTLYSWPQLASAATLSGSTIAYTVRRIANGEPVREGKHQVSMDYALNPNYEAEMEKQAEAAEKFLEMFNK